MTQSPPALSTAYRPLLFAWAVLLVLTLISAGLSVNANGGPGLQVLVALIIGVKAHVVARHFIEVHCAHPFIRRVTYGFVAFTPTALVLTAFFGQEFAHWAARWLSL